MGDVLRLFNRNNGAPKDDLKTVNATCDLNWPEFVRYLHEGSAVPPLRNIVQYDMGRVGGVSLGFTDAAAVADYVYFSAAAEDSENALVDGPVLGSVVGVLRPDGTCGWIDVLEGGGGFGAKIEGLVVCDGAETAYAIVDCDSPDAASELVELQLSGRWTK